jgi:hypothetical protein
VVSAAASLPGSGVHGHRTAARRAEQMEHLQKKT